MVSSIVADIAVFIFNNNAKKNSKSCSHNIANYSCWQQLIQNLVWKDLKNCLSVVLGLTRLKYLLTRAKMTSTAVWSNS